ncbi:MAG: PIN domain-containing protein [Candidatus Hydrothermarchaeota archaeon]|nr:PIN domain-containing protein [Candidatus Hydrothermarchaeota archaeon]
MRLSEFHGVGKIYIDSTIFISHHSKDARDKESCTNFLKKVEAGRIDACTSSVVVEETAYILLKFKAAEILGSDRHYEIISTLRKDRNLFDDAWRVAEEHIQYVNALGFKGVLQIITQTAEPSFIGAIARKNRLLPRDATHVGIMKRNGIENIATSDSDFERVDFLKVWKP